MQFACARSCGGRSSTKKLSTAHTIAFTGGGRSDTMEPIRGFDSF